ncbi:MAG TPA: site-2 protease family protein [Phycisphaerales bacterium]|nr:site-2 protease family protein [Phycisphaerales bacterium]
MGLQDRDYNRGGGDGGGGRGDYGEGGGFRRAMRRIFVEGDGFYGWSLPLFRVPRWMPGLRGIEVRVHLLYVVFIIAQLVSSLSYGSFGLTYQLAMMVGLFVSVLLHEFGHCLACRMTGGEADQVLMWPLGGLACCRPRHTWQANLITTIGGPAVTLLIMIATGIALVAAGGGWESVLFNPLHPGMAASGSWMTSTWKIWLWSAYYMNLVLFAFNVFLPMYPLDSGRMLQEVLWSRIGYKRSMEIAVNIGLVLAAVLGTVALVADRNNYIFSVCLFCAISCYMQRQQLRFMEDEEPWSYQTDLGNKGFKNTHGPKEAEADKAYHAALKRQQKERDQQLEVDRILAKIREKGMQSLSWREKATLKEATERTRGKG